jgi:hypothetical protein
MTTIRRVLLVSIVHWTPLATLTVLVSGMVYGVVQQAYRSTANDPQIQMAMDARNALINGAPPQSLVPTNQVDIAQSLAPYLVIYDASHQIVATSATVHGEALIPPRGVFASADILPMDTITWTPEPGVRSAIVVMRYSGGYVLAGRSLQQIEERESQLEMLVGGGCVLTLALTLLAVLVTRVVAARLVPTRETTQ